MSFACAVRSHTPTEAEAVVRSRLEVIAVNDLAAAVFCDDHLRRVVTIRLWVSAISNSGGKAKEQGDNPEVAGSKPADALLATARAHRPTRARPSEPRLDGHEASHRP